jgi:hypothetical protein
MNSSSQRICSGRSGCEKPASVAIRMKPKQGHVRRDQEHEALLDVGHDPASFTQAVHEGRERVIAEHQV